MFPNPNGNASANSEKIYQLKGTNTTGEMGLGIALKVMGGDTINIFGKSYYFDGSITNPGHTLPVTAILSGLLGTSSGSIAAKGMSAGDLNSVTGIGDIIEAFAEDGDRTVTGKPKAAINWILFDDQLKVVKTGFSLVGSSGTVKNHYDDGVLQDIEVTKMVIFTCIVRTKVRTRCSLITCR